jgi:hypothetical protein
MPSTSARIFSVVVDIQPPMRRLVDMTRYRIDYTEMTPGRPENYTKQSTIVHGEDVRCVMDYLDTQLVYGRDPIVVIEQTQSDGPGRIVPASEWDVCE